MFTSLLALAALVVGFYITGVFLAAICALLLYKPGT